MFINFKIKSLLVLIVLFITISGFSLPNFPSDKTVESDAAKRLEARGKVISIQKDGAWETKVILRKGVQLTSAFIKYSAKLDFKSHIKNATFNVVYILDKNEWIFDDNAGFKWSDEIKAGVGPSSDEVKEIIKTKIESEKQSFFDEMACSKKIQTPVKIQKVLLSKPKAEGSSIIYYADIEFQDSKANQFNFKNIKVDMLKQENGYKTVLKTILGKCKK